MLNQLVQRWPHQLFSRLSFFLAVKFLYFQVKFMGIESLISSWVKRVCFQALFMNITNAASPPVFWLFLTLVEVSHRVSFQIRKGTIRKSRSKDFQISLSPSKLWDWDSKAKNHYTKTIVFGLGLCVCVFDCLPATAVKWVIVASPTAHKVLFTYICFWFVFVFVTVTVFAFVSLIMFAFAIDLLCQLTAQSMEHRCHVPLSSLKEGNELCMCTYLYWYLYLPLCLYMYLYLCLYLPCCCISWQRSMGHPRPAPLTSHKQSSQVGRVHVYCVFVFVFVFVPNIYNIWRQHYIVHIPVSHDCGRQMASCDIRV